MKIGYQGDFGSNSYYVAKEYDCEAELIPLISSEGVLGALEAGTIDLGVVAVENSLGGIVAETELALAKREGRYRQLAGRKVPIHHCLFVLPGTRQEEIQFVASHIQALKQTRQYLAWHLPKAVCTEAPDTALAAARLAEGKYGREYAVVCRREAGLHYGLEMIGENIEDSGENITSFAILATME